MLSTVDSATPCQSIVNTIPHRHTHRWTKWDKSSIVNFFSEDSRLSQVDSYSWVEKPLKLLCRKWSQNPSPSSFKLRDKPEKQVTDKSLSIVQGWRGMFKVFLQNYVDNYSTPQTGKQHKISINFWDKHISSYNLWLCNPWHSPQNLRVFIYL